MPEPDNLALDESSSFTIGTFVEAVFKSVPATITREQVLATLGAYQDTFAHPDIEKRLALFTEDCEIEDPAGLPRARGKAAMEAFFRSTLDNGVRVDRRPVERIVVGDEAIEHIAMMIEKDGMSPHPLAHVAHYVFDDQAKIKRVRVFFDLQSVSRQPAPDPQGGW